jgi:hypothetical protein
LKNIALGQGLGGARQVLEVREDDEGTLAAQFVVDPLEVGTAAGVVQHAPAGAGGAGEADGVHLHVQRQRLAGFVAVAGHHVEDARRQAGLQRQFGQPQGGQGDFSLGLSTTELPVASAGPSFQAAMIIG